MIDKERIEERREREIKSELVSDGVSTPNDPRASKRTNHVSESTDKRKVHGILNASSKICSLVVNGQSFLVTDGSLLNLF